VISVAGVAHLERIAIHRAESEDKKMHILIVASAFVISAAFAEAAAAEDKGKGSELFNNNCRTCHSWKEGDNRLGPNLHGIVGRKAGSVSGFNYSGSMKSAGITWDEATLEKFITNPDSVVQNNNMKPFTGISDAATRKGIIDFLKSNPE
jgi:cytochrome c